EVRNAVYRGQFTKLLHKVADGIPFRSLWGIPLDDGARLRNGTYKRMADLEMALRFFAFQRRTEFTGSLKGFLNEFMDRRNAEYREDPALCDRDKALFQETHARTQTLLGDEAF